MVADIIIDAPLSEGSHSWSIKLDEIDECLAIGVAHLNLEANSSFEVKSFWGYGPCLGEKLANGSSEIYWGREAEDGDVVEVQLEFLNNKGKLSFVINGESLGVLCDNLDPPLYPSA